MTQPPRTPGHLQVLLIAGFAFLTACSKTDSAATADSAPATPAEASSEVEEDLADLSKYQLTMAKYDKYLAAQRSIALKAKSLSPAEKQAMKARQESRDNSDATLDEMAKNIEAEPMMVAAIRDAGLSAREFAVLTMSIMQTAMAASVVKMRPTDNQDSLIREMKANPANVKFFRDNEAALTKKQQDLEAEMKRLGVDSES